MTASRRHPSRRRLLEAAAVLTALAACGVSPSPTIYTLMPGPGSDPRRCSGTVAVKTVEIAKYLDRPQIVRRAAPYELQVSEFERWGEGMREMVTRVVVDSLSTRLPSCQVFAASGPLSMRADTTVEIEMSRFDPEPDGTVIIVARWTVLRERERDSRKNRFHADRIVVAGGPANTATLVRSMSEALAQLSDRIAATVST